MAEEKMTDEELDRVVGGAKIAFVSPIRTKANGKQVYDVFACEYSGDISALISLFDSKGGAGLKSLGASISVTDSIGVRAGGIDKYLGILTSQGYTIHRA